MSLLPIPRAVAVTLLLLLACSLSTSLAEGKPDSSRAATAKRQMPRAARAPVKGVRPMFDHAMGLYEAGQFSQALMAFDALLRKYPGHEPATLQLAKTLYRLDRIKEAYNIFQRVSPQYLDPETSYEYGWSFYTNKQWEGALSGFQRVPKGHALFDLANYYGALCAIKLKRYEDAGDMLEKAVVLPDKLAKSRTLYIKHVQALRLMQQKNHLTNERRRLHEAMRNQGRTKDKPKPKDVDSPPKVGNAYQHKGKRYIERFAKVSYANQHQYIDMHGLSESNYDAKVANFELRHGPLLPIPGWVLAKDRQAAFGLQVMLGAEDRITKGEQQRILIDENEEDLTRLSRTDLGTTDKKLGTVSGEPWLEFPLPEDIWMTVGGVIAFNYPDFERGLRDGSRKAYLQLAGSAPPLGFLTEISYAEILDVKTEPTITKVGGKVAIDSEVADKLLVIGTISHTLYDYLVDEKKLDGPDSATRGEVEAIQTLPLGFSASLLGAFEQQTNYIFHNIPPFGQLAADGQVLTGTLTLSAAPFPWVFAELSQLVTKTTWQLENDAARDSFERNVPDYLERFTGTVGINMNF